MRGGSMTGGFAADFFSSFMAWLRGMTQLSGKQRLIQHVQPFASANSLTSRFYRLRKQISGFEEIKTSARTVVGGGEKILNRARLMEEEISKRLSALGAQMQRLRHAAGEGIQ